MACPACYLQPRYYNLEPREAEAAEHVAGAGLGGLVGFAAGFVTALFMAAVFSAAASVPAAFLLADFLVAIQSSRARPEYLAALPR